MAPWNVDDTSVSLGIPGLGSIRVSRTYVSIEGPDSAAREATWARLGNWATVQFYAARGLAVLPGCAIGRDGKAVVVTGLPRHGATLLGLQLTRHGWALISDGLVALDSSGACQSTGPWATVDAEPARHLFPDYPQEAYRSGRDRCRVRAPDHGDAPFCAIVNVRVKESLNALAVATYCDPADAGRYRPEPVSSAVPQADAVPGIPWRPVVTIARPVPTTLAEMQAISPIAMAERLAPLLAGLL